MLSVYSQRRYYLYREATDMRKSFDGLCGLLRHHTDHNVQSGDVFIFFNKRRTLVKLLMWEGSGFSIYYKRLEVGTFGQVSSRSATPSIRLDWASLVMLLEGVELAGSKRRKRYKKVG